MKKSLFFALITMGVSFSSAFAQVGAGKVFLGGGFGYSSSSSEFTGGGVTVEGPKSTVFNFVPNARYFFSDNLAAGLGLGFQSSSVKFINGAGDEEIDSENYFYLNPNVRYYHSFSESFYAFAEAGLTFGAGSSKNELAGTTTDGPKVRGVSIYAAPGLSFFPTEKFAVDFRLTLLRINSSTETDPTDSSIKDKSSSFDFGFNTLSPSIGIYYIL